MKYVKQLLIILSVSFAGEGLHYLLPLPIPASIYGMVLLFVLLVTGALKPEAVKETGCFLVEIMPVMFIPAGVGLMSSWSVLRPMLLPVSVITVVSLVLVMGFSGRVTQFILRRGSAGEPEEHDAPCGGRLPGRDGESGVKPAAGEDGAE